MMRIERETERCCAESCDCCMSFKTSAHDSSVKATPSEDASYLAYRSVLTTSLRKRVPPASRWRHALSKAPRSQHACNKRQRQGAGTRPAGAADFARANVMRRNAG